MSQRPVLNPVNMITLARMAAAPVVMVLMYFPGRSMAWVACLVFVAACLTDLVDGMLARRWDMVTSLGKFLDPLADKVLMGAVLVMLVHLDRAPAWVVVLILSREMAVTGMRAVAAEKGIVVAADRYGKLKTVLQIVALSPLILGGRLWFLDLELVGLVLLYVAMVITLFSGGNYLYNFYKNLLKNS